MKFLTYEKWLKRYGYNNGICDACDGNGFYECDNCYGTGEVECPHCGYEGDCPICEGEGTVECEDCDGTGWSDCRVSQDTPRKMYDAIYNKEITLVKKLDCLKK